MEDAIIDLTKSQFDLIRIGSMAKAGMLTYNWFLPFMFVQVGNSMKMRMKPLDQLTIHEMERLHISTINQQGIDAINLLRELCALKEYRQQHGPNVYYYTKQTALYKAANEFLNKLNTSTNDLHTNSASDGNRNTGNKTDI